jgi:hypothetical protein
MTSTITTLKVHSDLEQQQAHHSPRCALKWRQGQLFVTLEQCSKQPYLPTLESKQRLVECLKRSPVRLIRINLDLGEAQLRLWADACEQASKAVFLRLPSAHELPSSRCPRRWWLKRLIDWSAAALLLLALSPAMLGLVLLMRFYSPEPIFLRQWCVGERGKLFRVFKFRTIVVKENNHRITRLGRWMRKYSLDELPQLFNVLRFEMSLVGPRPWALYDAVRISPEIRQQLNALPGII